MDLSNPGMSITELSAAETILYSECVERIAKGPATPEGVGEALWGIQEQRLYRDKVGDMYTFLCTGTKIEPEEGLKIIDAWKLSPPGQAVVGAELGVDGGEDGLAADEPIDWNPPPRVRKATFTTPAPDSAKEAPALSIRPPPRVKRPTAEPGTTSAPKTGQEHAGERATAST